jgi:hypothetical protein
LLKLLLSLNISIVMKTKKTVYKKNGSDIKPSKKRTLKNKNRSFSPLVNKKLDVNSLKTLKNRTIKLCDSLLEINTGTVIHPKCLKFNSMEVKKFLLKNLMSSKHLKPEKFIAPKQLYSNCWFNTMFVTFFFSDKGRKFFRFFRNLMITGKKQDNSMLDDQRLRKSLFIFNLYIEASYNQSLSGTSKNKMNLHEQVKILTSNLDTNFLIKNIYNIIKQNEPIYDLPDIDESGNPLEFYQIIMQYLKYDVLNILRIDVDKNSKQKYKTTNEILDNLFKRERDIVVFEDHESGMDYETSYEVELKGKKYKYILDSIIMTNKGYYNPKDNSHFVSVLTINGVGYKFDGGSYSRLSKFNWKKQLNTNKDFTFKENPAFHPEKYNFSKAYKILFYYRT